MILYYAIDIVVGFIAGLINISQGPLLKGPTVKGISLLLAILALAALCVLTFMNYFWLHIVGLIGAFILSAQLAAFLMIKRKMKRDV